MIPTLRPPPHAGSGVHKWIFYAACRCHQARLPEVSAQEFIQEQVIGCGRRVYQSEIRGAIRSAYQLPADGLCQPPRVVARSTPEMPIWPKPAREKQRLIMEIGIGEADLAELSPVGFEMQDAEFFIDALYPDNPLLCIGRANKEFATRRREKWRGRLARLPRMVPNPMSAQHGLTQDGKWSEWSKANTGERRYLVLDFDGPINRDGQAALLWYLAAKRPLVLVMFSGGKSLHGWFKMAGVPEAAVLAFMEEAVSLGADSALFYREHFARIPGGRRLENGQLQAVIYFNPGGLPCRS